MDGCEVAAAVLEPHFAAVRDVFAGFEPAPGVTLTKLRKTYLVIDPNLHATPQRFAACRDDAALIKLAPEAMELEHDQLVAILCHEFGHAADFAYPGDWVMLERDEPAVWVGGREDRYTRRWRRLWHERNDDQVEWSADAIAWAVIGKPVRYCGPCMIQCFAGISRPPGLR